uniref:Cobalt ECF transporter T component CbiQ n=1 Tax=Desulfacinum infernum TaxID=35837 RepID=A0A832A2B1_9BACT
MSVTVIPWWAAAFVVAAATAAMASLWLFSGFDKRGKGESDVSSDSDADASVPELDAAGSGSSFFHRWDPRCKIFSLVFFSFVVVSLNHGFGLFAGLAVAAGSLVVAGTPLRAAARRLSAMSGFLLMLLFIMPLTVPFHEGDRRIVLEGVPFVPFNARGFVLAARICAKAVIVALLMEPLLKTAPFSVTMAAVQRLGVPVVLCQMILLMYRYVFVFRHEMQRMWVGMTVRGFRSRSGWDTLGHLGCFVGMLFVRSMERTQRVYEAMLCRGYTGVFPSTVQFCATPRDWAWAALWVGTAVGLFALDRWQGAVARFLGF